MKVHIIDMCKNGHYYSDCACPWRGNWDQLYRRLYLIKHEPFVRRLFDKGRPRGENRAIW